MYSFYQPTPPEKIFGYAPDHICCDLAFLKVIHDKCEDLNSNLIVSMFLRPVPIKNHEVFTMLKYKSQFERNLQLKFIV